MSGHPRGVHRLFLGLGAITAMLLACRAAPLERLEYTELDSPSEGRRMRLGIYEAPTWDGEREVPLVILLHGAGDDETAADRRAVIQALDAATASGEVPPFILAAPNGDRGFWLNWYDGSHRYRDWVLQDVIAYMRDRYPIIAGREGLHLIGVSMGGGGGLQMWLSAPERFASATILSAPILDEDETRTFLRRFMPKRGMERVFGPPGSGVGKDPYEAFVGPSDLQGGRLTFGAATRDLGRILESNQRFHEHLRARDVPHRFLTFPGRHGWAAWAPVFVDTLCHELQPTCPRPTANDWTVAGSDRTGT